MGEKERAVAADGASDQRIVERVDAENAAHEGAPGTHPEFDRLVRTVWRLRQADGCPWDRAQTHATISKNMVEEAYEAVQAIADGDARNLCEELGDVLEQVVLHAQIAADEGDFGVDDVCRGINQKLVRRHPHVFGPEVVGVGLPPLPEEAGAEDDAPAGLAADTPEQTNDIWDQVKRRERAAKGLSQDGEPGLLDSVPRSLPALMQCQKVSVRAARVGFEWACEADVWDQVASERAEMEAEPVGSASRAEEFGDLLFSLVNVARWEGIDAEEALATSTAKFRRRWAGVEKLAREAGTSVDGLSTAELNELWNRVKSAERGQVAR